MKRAPLEVGLFVTCLVDAFRPTVGFAAVKLLEEAGCRVSVPEAQTCCGQPAYNSGDRADALAIAKAVIAAFRGFDYVVVPSGSCGGMLKLHYPALLAGDPSLRDAAADLARRTYELVSFLTDVLGIEEVGARFDGDVAYHDSCSALRELGVQAQPRKLLDSVAGLRRTELPNAEVCCGFGGTFCVKYSEISADIVRKKAESVVASGAGTLLSGDMGCLLNIAGKLQRDGARVAVRHVAEVLAGMTETPPIGGSRA
ncbi:MAG: (Fe-S)-binding protein [Candidatus Baltobacteraceae bacterium]|jgi:L-lactate dehydrogenase complex protein LldE